MKLLQAAKPLTVHPEVRDQFHELLRFHFAAHRKGKEPGQVLADMRTRDAREQAALLSGKCEMEIVLTHQRSCESVRWLDLRCACDCTPTREIKFIESKLESDFMFDVNRLGYSYRRKDR